MEYAILTVLIVVSVLAGAAMLWSVVNMGNRKPPAERQEFIHDLQNAWDKLYRAAEILFHKADRVISAVPVTGWMIIGPITLGLVIAVLMLQMGSRR